MQPDAITHNADWMVPALIVGLSVASAIAAGLVVWIVQKAITLALQFREDVLKRLDLQDGEQVQQRALLSAIKELLQDRFHKLHGRMLHHDVRISRLEQHNGLHPLKRTDDDSPVD